MEKELNKSGKTIEICKMFDLKILNGRLGRDIVIGNFTWFTDRESIIDHTIVPVQF